MSLWTPPAPYQCRPQGLGSANVSRRYRPAPGGGSPGHSYAAFGFSAVSGAKHLIKTSPVGISVASAFTMAGWLNVAGGSFTALLGRYDSTQAAIGWFIGSDTVNHLSLVTGNVAFQSTITLPTNAWHFLCARGSGSAVSLSLDGGAEQSGSYSLDGAEGNPLLLGWYKTASYNPMSGAGDSIGFWNRQITPTEIAHLYNGGVGLAWYDIQTTYTTLNDAKAWWDCDEATGATRVDATGNGNDMTDSGSVPQVAGVR